MVRVFSTQVDVVKQTVSELATSVKTEPSEKVEWVDATSTGTIASGNSEVVVVKPPAGYLYELMALTVNIGNPSGASGTHSLELRAESLYQPLLEGIADYTTRIRYRYGYWREANDTQFPVNTELQNAVIDGLRMDETNGIEFFYTNNTDVDQTNDRNYYLWVRKIKVA